MSQLWTPAFINSGFGFRKSQRVIVVQSEFMRSHMQLDCSI